MIDLLNEVQSFWSGMRMAVMNRQQGLTWDDAGRMQITYFFHVLKLSERKDSGDSGGNNDKLSRSGKRAKQ